MDTPPEPTQKLAQSRVTYNSVILFMYSVDAQFPFSSANLKDLTDTDFPFYLVDGALDDDSRTVPFKLYSDQSYCVFAKVEHGE